MIPTFKGARVEFQATGLSLDQSQLLQTFEARTSGEEIALFFPSPTLSLPPSFSPCFSLSLKQINKYLTPEESEGERKQYALCPPDYMYIPGKSSNTKVNYTEI